MKCCPSRANVDKVLGCICRRWGPENNTAHKFGERSCILEEDSLRAGKRKTFEPFCSIKGKTHVVTENFAVHALSDGVPWSLRGFNRNKFYRPMTSIGAE